MTNSVAATISSLILLLALGQQTSCQANQLGAHSSASSSPQSGHTQNQLAVGQKEQAEARELLLNQLLRLSPPAEANKIQKPATTGEQEDLDGGRRLESLLASAPKKHQLAKKPSKQRDEYAQDKAMLKEKLHKLLDELVDSEAREEKFAMNKPQARSRQPTSAVKAQANSVEQDHSSGDEPLAVILIKRKPQLAAGLDDELANAPTFVSNNLADLERISVSNSAQQQSSPVNIGDHQRRILDDKFGILGHSIFTTNNQLGNKGVPKFGADEQF